MTELDLKGWSKVTPATLPEPVKLVLVVDASGRKGVGYLIARPDMPLGNCWSINGTSGFIVKPPLFWRDYPELPEGYDY